MGKILELPKSSSRLLTSSQIITSVYCVVKELVENGLDGASRNVEVKLEDYGLEKIEVKDNGCGIDKNDIQFVAKPHFTSKITSYSDLEKISSYGFRGEALGAICAVADLVITTKSSEEAIGCTVNFSHDGQVISSKPSSCAQGSTISVSNLFKNIPVRRQFYRSEKHKKDDLRKVEELLVAYGCIQHDIRFALYHNKSLIWQKPALSCTKNALIHILGNSVVDHLKYSEFIDEQNQRKMEAYLPPLAAPLTCGLSTSSRCITAINKRPVRMKAIDKLLKEYYNKAIQNPGKARYPISFISFTLPLTEVDVNIEPNKTSVMLHHVEDILAQFSDMLKTFYKFNANEEINQNMLSEKTSLNPEQKLNSSDFLTSLQAKCDATFQQTKLSFITESPVNAENKNVNNLDTNQSFLNNHSTNRTENSLTKNDITYLDNPKKCKKKLKTASKSDINHHINSLKDFFSEDTNNKSPPTRISDNLLSSAPRVTVERFSSNQPSPNSQVEKPNCSAISNTTTTFAVSTNMHSDNNSHISNNFPINRKRHFSDSSISSMKATEDTLKRPALCDMNIQNGEAWSRGVDAFGGLFQPVKVLLPKTVAGPESVPTKSPETVTSPPKTSPELKNLSVERKLTAFDIFCRSNRLEIAAQNPDYSNQQIALILSEKWNGLSSEEKAVYRNMQDKNYKQEVKKKERLSQLMSQSLNQNESKISDKVSKKKLKSKIKAKTVTFSSGTIKELFQYKRREPDFDDLKIINYLAPGIWVCAKEKKLYILNTFRLQETVIYRRLLETFLFETEPLDIPRNITANHIGDEGMEILLGLCNVESNNNKIIDDERLTANGFEVQLIKGPQNKVAFQLVGITRKISFYNIPDLKEVLMLISKKGCSSKLSECRPGKIIFYLQSEANRMSRQSPACQRVQDVEALLNQNNSLSKCHECIHCKPFFTQLWNFQSS